MPTTAEIASFWEKTRAKLAEVPMDATTEPVEGWADRTLTAYRVIMNSFENIKIRAWYILPNGTPPEGGWPAVMELPPGRGTFLLPGYLTRFGYVTLALFPRGLGESKHEYRLEGDTGQTEFRLLNHVTDPDRYYYRSAYMDCLRGLDFLDSRPEVDSTRLAVWGASQGGGFSLATAALDHRPKACVARLPFMCNFPEASKWTKRTYNALRIYLAEHPDNREAAMDTLAYFDNLNLAEQITCPSIVSAARKDSGHPIHTIMPVFEKIPALKRIMVYHDADGVGADDQAGVTNVDFNRHSMDWLERYVG